MSGHAARPHFRTPAMESGFRETARQITAYWWLWLVTGIAWIVVSLVILQFDDASITTVGILAAGQLVTAPADEHCEVAAELMRGHRVSDLMVVDPERNQPPGVISTLDVAGTVAGGRA